MLLTIQMVNQPLEGFMKKTCKRLIEWKGYDNSFKSQADKKDIV